MLKAVLVGCGGISGAWLKALQGMPEVMLVGLVDLYEEVARKRAAEFNLVDAIVSNDLPAALRQTEPDVVFDCTVPEAHLPVTLTALQHGCHVLGEKPLADSMENARRMIAAADEAGKIVAVVQNRRYDPRIRRLRHLIESDALGRLTTLNADFYIGAHFGGFRDRMEHVLLLDMAIHTFDQARFISGEDPVAVYCKEWNPPGSWYDHEASAVAVFQMTNNLVYTYRGSWCAEGLNTTWEGDWRVVGEKGSATWDGADGFRAEVVGKTGGFRSEMEALEVPPFDAGDKVGGHAGVIREFLRCVQTGETPETVAADNIKSLAMVFGAIESARLRREVEIKV